MTKPLDPRFIKIVALMNSTAHEGEKAAARARAEAIAKSCGLTFDQAMAASKCQPAQPKPANIFEGCDDWMEKREPGYKGRKAKERAEKAAARRARVKILLQNMAAWKLVSRHAKETRSLCGTITVDQICKPPILFRKTPSAGYMNSLSATGSI